MIVKEDITPLRNVALIILTLAILVGLFFAANSLMGKIFDQETWAADSKQQIAGSVLASAVDSLNDEIYSSKAPSDSKIDGLGGSQAAKGNIWVEGTTTPVTFYIPATPILSNYSHSYVDIEGTVEDYTVTYSDSYLNATAVYSSTTDKIEVTDGAKPLTEESQG